MPEKILAAISLAVVLVIAGCATASGSAGPPGAAPIAGVESAQPATAPKAVVPAAPPVVCEARLGTDRLRRSSLKRTVDAGLGRWLQSVSVDRMLVRGHFKGWIIRSLRSEDSCYTGVDLRVGDVVTRVNGRPIERPEEALAVWTALPSSSELVVDLVRDGEPRSVRFGIADQ